MNQLVKGLMIGSFIGGAVGAWLHDNKGIGYSEKDLVVIEKPTLVPTAVPTPKVTPTLTTCIPPQGWCPCPTKEPTPDAKAKAYWEKERKERDLMDIRIADARSKHENDFIAIPKTQFIYMGYPVEFLPPPAYVPNKWTDTLDESMHEHEKRYMEYYNIHAVEEFDFALEKSDTTRINGWRRAAIFSDLPKETFESLHKPFYGIKIVSGLAENTREPSPTWIYCVWSLKNNAPIPFPYPSRAIEYIKRQQGKK